MCVAIGFWNDVHVDIEKLRAEGSDFGPVLRIMPHPTKAPHKHAFMQYSSRSIAENAKMALRKKLNQLQFVQKVGWGRPPKLVKESFKFDSGVGEILKADAMHIRPGQQHSAPPPPNYGAMNANRTMPTSNATATPAAAAAPPAHSGGAFMNPQRAQLIASSQPQYPYNPAMQYAQYPYNPMQAQHVPQGQPPQQAVQAQYPQYR